MNKARALLGIGLILTLAACVTINIYFPAKAAEKAADKVIEEVWGKDPAVVPAPATPGPGARMEPGTAFAVALLDLLVPAAQAQQADINVSTPAINSILASMRTRHDQLAAHYDNGGVGLTGDGLVTVRSPGAIPLSARRQVNQLVAEENRDRNALYREIASANGHPEWEQDIRATFARRWVGNARDGWWYQDAGGRWLQK